MHKMRVAPKERTVATSVGVVRAGMNDFISDEDLQKIYNYVQISHPVNLLYKVWFDIYYYFLLTDHDQGMAQNFQRQSFALRCDQARRRYVALLVDHDPSSAHVQLERRMYEMPGSAQCPVGSFLRYVSRLHPAVAHLWQRPRDVYRPNEPGVWYDMFPLGTQKLTRMMAALSHLAGLSAVYRVKNVQMTALRRLQLAGVAAPIIGELIQRAERGARRHHAKCAVCWPVLRGCDLSADVSNNCAGAKCTSCAVFLKMARA